MNELYGMKVYVNPDLDNVPKMTVNKRFAELMPQAFVDDLNAWMLDFFGTQSVMYQIGNHGIAMGPKLLEAVKREAGFL